MLEKKLEDFHNCKSGRLGKKAKCKKCTVLTSAEYHIENTSLIKERRKKQYINNKEKIIKRVSNYKNNNNEKVSKYQKEYKQINKETLNKKNVERNKIDEIYYLKGRFRKAICASIKKKGFVKFLNTENVLGCDFDFFKEYLESQFKKGMRWSNIHIDHIIPLKSAKTEEEVLLLNHYTNLQPLFVIDNLKKGAKIIEKQLKLI